MIKDYFEVPDVEHDGDIEYFKGIIQDAGGTITGSLGVDMTVTAATYSIVAATKTNGKM